MSSKELAVTAGDAAESQGSSTVNRALRVLEELGSAPEGLTASELAQRTGVNRVTVHRILAALKSRGFVRQQSAGERYRLGFKFLELAESVLADADVVRLAYPLLEELAQRSGETCHLALLDGSAAVYIAKVESPQAVRLVSRVGIRMPLYCTSLGKALLASASPSRAAKLIDAQGFERRTPNTIVSKKALLEELYRIRARGYAVDWGENEPGVRCVGAAVLARGGEAIGAISLSGPEWRLDEGRLAELGNLVAETSRTLSSALKGQETK